MDNVDRISYFLHSCVYAKKGELVSICAVSSIPGIEAFLAMNKLGLVNARIFNGTQEEKMREYLIRFASRTVFTDVFNLPAVLAGSKGTSVENIVILSPRTETGCCEDIQKSIGMKLFYYEDIIDCEPDEFFAETVKADDLAAVLFTSGSEGEPKSIAIPNRSYVNMVETNGRIVRIKHNDGEKLVGVVSHEYPFGAVSSSIMVLLMGKTLIMPKVTHDGEIDFSELLNKKPCRMQAIPNFYKLLQEYIKQGNIEKLDFLKNILSGGETFTVGEKISLYNTLNKAGSRLLLLDGFGFGELGGTDGS